MIVDDSGDGGMLNKTIIYCVFIIVGEDNWVGVVVAFFFFSSVTCSKICFCGLCFVKLDAVTLLTNAGYSLVWVWMLVFVAHGLILGAHRDDFGWLLESMIMYVDRVK